MAAIRFQVKGSRKKMMEKITITRTYCEVKGTTTFREPPF